MPTYKGKLGVDAGNISAVDVAFVRAHGGTIPHGTDLIKVKTPGRYKVRVAVSGTWNGAAVAEAEVDVQGDAIAVGDVCYLFEEPHWAKFLEATDDLKDLKGRGVCADTGGNGEFSVHASAVRVDAPNPNHMVEARP